MPTQKYRVDTDKGSYEVEVEVPGEPKSGDPGFKLPGGSISGMVAGGKGFLKGLPIGVAKAITSIPAGAISLGIEALSTVADTADLLSRGSKDPAAYTDALDTAYKNVTSMPGQMGQQAGEFLIHLRTLAENDPEAYGRAIGEMTGNVEAGIAGAKLVPKGLRPLGRRVGTALEETGKLSKWPMRISGSHAILGGNPAGIAMIAAPPMLERGGTRLKEFGEMDPAFQAAQSVKGLKASLKLSTPQQSKAISELQTSLGKTGERIGARALRTAKQGLSSVDAAIAEAKKEAGATRTAARKEEIGGRKAEEKADVEMSKAEQKTALQEEKDRILKEKAATIEAARAGMEPGKPSFSKSISAPTPEGGTQTMRQGFKKPGETELSDEERLAQVQKMYPGARPSTGGRPISKQIMPTIAPPTGTSLGGVRIASEPIPSLRSSEAIPGAGRVRPSNEEVAAANAQYTPAPLARAWSPETAAPSVGKGIAREPTRLVLSPEEAAQEAQTLKAYKPSAQVQGMKAAARVPAGDLEQAMQELGLTEMEKESLRRSMGSR